MLVVFPTEVGFDRKNPPYLTFILMMLTVMSYVVFQIDDHQKQKELFDFYQSSELFAKEFHPFNAYLKTEQGKQNYRDISSEKLNGPERMYYMIFDLEFREFLQSQLSGQHADIQTWQVLNRELAQQKSTITTHEFGVRPDNTKSISLITHTFLHGGPGHLFGNLVFLFLFGLGVEKLFGRVKMLLIYFGSGAIGALVFTVLDGKSFMPLVGASGAISGLMGAYAAYFGLQKIRFLGWFGIYFNQFLWPAISVLAFWLLKELFSQWTETESNVAYMAHFGGLMMGALSGWLLKTRLKDNRPADQSSENSQTRARNALHSPLEGSSSDLPTDPYQTALKHIREMEFNEARALLTSILEATPDNLNALKSLYHIDKVNTQSSHFLPLMNRVFSFNPSIEMADDFVLQVYQTHFSQHVTHDALSIEALFGLSQRLLRCDRVQAAEPLVTFSKKQLSENKELPKLLYHWGMALIKRGKLRSGVTELNYLANYYGETSFGQAAIEQIKRWKNA